MSMIAPTLLISALSLVLLADGPPRATLDQPVVNLVNAQPVLVNQPKRDCTKVHADREALIKHLQAQVKTQNYVIKAYETRMKETRR